MSKFFSSRLSSLEAYVPGEQPKDMAYIKLNTNESPFPPAPAVRNALTEDTVAKLRLYCDPEASRLKAALADSFATDASRVFVSNGSDDILNFAFLAFGEGGVAFPDISYGFYEVFARLHGIAAEKIPLAEDFSITPKDYFAKGKMVCIANPNAPTGMALSLEEVEAIVKSNPDSVVLIDEAYVDFGGESCAALTKKYKNLLCVGTFSKSRSMAGARLGFAVADEALIADLERVKYSTNPYNVNSLTQLLGVLTLENQAYYTENCQRIIEARAYATKALEALGFSVLPSSANFIFAKSDRIGGEALYLALKARGVLVRHFEKPRIADYNRITVGTLADMQALVAAVKDILSQ